MRSRPCCHARRRDAESRDADRVEQALAGDANWRGTMISSAKSWPRRSTSTRRSVRRRARHGKAVRRYRCEEARAPRRERSFDLGGRISELLSSSPRARSPGRQPPRLCDLRASGCHCRGRGQRARCPERSGSRECAEEGSFAVVRFCAASHCGRHQQLSRAYKATWSRDR